MTNDAMNRDTHTEDPSYTYRLTIDTTLGGSEQYGTALEILMDAVAAAADEIEGEGIPADVELHDTSSIDSAVLLLRRRQATRYTKCTDCHLFVGVYDQDEDGNDIWEHHHRGDEADQELDGSHQARPEPVSHTLDWWKRHGPLAMRRRFTDYVPTPADRSFVLDLSDPGKIGSRAALGGLIAAQMARHPSQHQSVVLQVLAAMGKLNYQVVIPG